MIRALLLGCLTATLVALGTGSAQPPADEPEPPRLKKKTPNPPADEKPKAKAEEKKPAGKPEEKKPGEKAEPKDDPEAEAEAKAREILNRIAKNVESAKDRLKAKDPGDATQQIQRDIVKDLDELIEQTKNPPQSKDQQPQQAGGGGGGGGSKGGMGGGSGRSRSRGSARQQQRGQGGQQGGGNPMGQQGGQPQGKAGQQPGSGGQQSGQGGNQGGMGGTSPTGLDKLADVYKELWGELPLRERQEMDAYQKEGYMAKYRELLKQYYATIAEKGRRPAEKNP